MRTTQYSFCAMLALIVIVIASTGFRAGNRKYCRVRFGASDAQEVIFARASESLLLYRSGDLDAAPEQYPFKDGRLHEGVTIPAIKLQNGDSYAITSISEYTHDEPNYRHALMVHVEIDGDASFAQYCDVELSDKMQDLKLAHFDGPLAIGPVRFNWEIPAGTRLVIGGEPTDLRASVATLDKTAGCWTVVEGGDGKFPEGVHPTATVEFPAGPSAVPLVRTYALDEFC